MHDASIKLSHHERETGFNQSMDAFAILVQTRVSSSAWPYST